MIKYFGKSIKNEKLKSVKLIEEKDSYGTQKFYLDVTYEYVDSEENRHEINFPKIELSIMTDRFPVLNNSFCSDRSCLIKDTIDIGFGELNLLRNSENIFATDRIVEYSCKEMTIEEIQEKLGYKVKIIDKKEKKTDEQF